VSLCIRASLRAALASRIHVSPPVPHVSDAALAARTRPPSLPLKSLEDLVRGSGYAACLGHGRASAIKGVIRRLNAFGLSVRVVVSDDINGRASDRPQTATARRGASTREGEIEQRLKRRAQLIA
jgi:hypothetical protein